LRETLGQEVRLDLVARRKPIQGRGGEYFTNYAKTRGLVMTPINVEGRTALWVDTEAEEGAGAPGVCGGAGGEGGEGSGGSGFSVFAVGRECFAQRAKIESAAERLTTCAMLAPGVT
jgi:hypothetical protein